MSVGLDLQANLEPWKRVKRWSCVRCGKCCSILEVPVTYDEENRLKKYGDVFRKEKIGVYLKKDGHCIFYDKKCIIYEERPVACRKYPFYIRRNGEKDALFEFNGEIFYIYIDQSCSGVGLGFRVERAIKDLLNDLTKNRKNRKILIKNTKYIK